MIEKIWHFIEPAVIKILIVAVVLYVGRRLIKWTLKLIRKASQKAKLERGVVSFLTSLTNIVLYCVLIIVIAGIVGIPTASFIAVLGSCGVAVGLALQGSLSNFAGGVLILVMKPFIVGDYISVSGHDGTVAEIDICYTKLRTLDNRIVVLPNGSLSNSNLVNYSREPVRMVDTAIPVAYSTDIKALRKMLLELAADDEAVLADRETSVLIKGFDDSSVNVSFRVWVKTEDYWPAYFRIPEKVKEAMEENGFTIPFNQLDVHIDGNK